MHIRLSSKINLSMTFHANTFFLLFVVDVTWRDGTGQTYFLYIPLYYHGALKPYPVCYICNSCPFANSFDRSGAIMRVKIMQASSNLRDFFVFGEPCPGYKIRYIILLMYNSQCFSSFFLVVHYAIGSMGNVLDSWQSFESCRNRVLNNCFFLL